MAISDRIPNSKATVGANRRISAITIGVRHRRDLGDIEGLAASIAEVGLLHHRKASTWYAAGSVRAERAR